MALTWPGRASAISRSMAAAPWPEFNEEYLVEDEVDIVVQVNGKKRDLMTVPTDYDKAAIEQAALALDSLAPHLEGNTVRKVIVVPGKLVNIVAN